MSLNNNKGKLEEYAKKKSATLADLTLTEADRVISKANKQGNGSGSNSGNEEQSSTSASTRADDAVLKLEDKMIDALKAMKKLDAEAARDTVVKFIKRLKDADLLSEE